MADPQTYGPIDIQRYLHHKMLPQEMHEFEKALMNDAFLADAIEGYRNSDERLVKQHLSYIENELTKERAKVVPFVARKTGWWKIAAIILIVISGGLLTYSLLTKEVIGSMESKQIAEGRRDEKVTAKDSIAPVAKPLVQIDLLQKKEGSNKRSSSSPVINEDNKAAIVAIDPKVDSKDIARTDKSGAATSLMSVRLAEDTLTTEEVFKAKRMSLLSSANENVFKGKVLDKNGDPLPFTSIRATAKNIGTVCDAKGNFTLKAPDTILQVIVTSTGRPLTTTEISSKIPINKITLEDEKLSLAEEVVTGLVKKKKNSVTNIPADSLNEAEPVSGWHSFNEYLSKQTDSLKAISTIDFEDDIQLEFSINEQGRPTNIKASTDVDSLVAEKAIYILLNGPNWRNKKKDSKVKVKLTISF